MTTLAITTKQHDEIKNEIFKATDIKVANDDPIIQLMTIIDRITTNKVKEIVNDIESTSEKITNDLMSNQEKVNTAFDVKLDELKEILIKLENQKESIVADVWKNLNDRVTEKIQTELTIGIQQIVSNSNNKVNNERIMLRGAIYGSIVGVLLCAVLLFIFK